jgi:hypothetical protein
VKKPLEALERERERESSLESTKESPKIFRCRMRRCMESENFERCRTQWAEWREVFNNFFLKKRIKIIILIK